MTTNTTDMISALPDARSIQVRVELAPRVSFPKHAHPGKEIVYVLEGSLEYQIEGDANGAPHPDAGVYRGKFSGRYSHRIIKGGIGHNLPQEAPQAFAEAIVEVTGY